MKIALIADKDTINCFKLAGINRTYPIEDPNEAKKTIEILAQTSDIGIIIITDQLTNKIRDTINKITEENKYPIIVSIPNRGSDFKLPIDLITELIKRKTGIELKVK